MTIADIKEYAKDEYKQFYETMNDWKALVGAEAESKGYFEGGGRAGQVGLIVLAVAVGGFAIMGAIYSGSPWPTIIGIPSALAIFIISFFMPRRSKAASHTSLPAR